jgi:pyruvate dehydrogenase E1 component alpha subunit
MDRRKRIDLYLSMLRIRIVEDLLAEWYAEQEMRCPVHFCTGQEAVPAAVCSLLRLSDQVLSNHRCHGHYLAKGGDLKQMVAEMYGKATGCSGGKGGSMHLVNREVNFIGATSIVSGTIPVGAGLAFANKRKTNGDVSVVFFGDAATEEGVFYETMNYAALAGLPVLFVCENNLYSVNTPLHERQATDRKIYSVAASLGVRSARTDGNDVEAVYHTARKGLEHVRSGRGPYLMECMTYRYLEHCGPNLDTGLGCRTEQEVSRWKRRDPLTRYERKLIRESVITERYIQKHVAAITDEVTNAVLEAKRAPYPPARDLLKGVYAE